MIPGFSGRIHPAGFPFIAVAAVVTMIVWPLSSSAGLIGVFLTGWCLYFFRDPERVIPDGEFIVISPADGIIQDIVSAPLPSELGIRGGEWTRISIFLSIFDVHINRVPVSGLIIESVYNPGQFFNASLNKASELNERQSLLIQTPQNHLVGCVQIAGLIARRILCYARPDTLVKAGYPYGLIRFGSRVDVYVPSESLIHVKIGQRMIGGETILADLLHASL